MIFNCWIDVSVLAVITSRKLQHVLRSYKHEAFQKANYKLDLIEHHTLTKYILVNDDRRRALNTRNLPSKAVLEFSFLFSFSFFSTSYLAFHS